MTNEKPNNMMSTDGELKQWENENLKPWQECIMTHDEKVGLLDDLLTKMYKLQSKGLTIGAIAKEVDLPEATVRNLLSTENGEIKRSYIMSRAEAQEFLKPKNDMMLNEMVKLQKNSIYGKMACENDPVNHPSHYTDGKIEVIDFIEDKKLNFHLANAVKYISRAGKKDPSKEIEDLKKARWYLDRYIQKLEEAQKGNDNDGDETVLYANGVPYAKIPVNKEE